MSIALKQTMLRCYGNCFMKKILIVLQFRIIRQMKCILLTGMSMIPNMYLW